MKTRLVSITIAAALLSGGATSRAVSPEAKTPAKMTEPRKRMDPGNRRLVAREMVRRKDLRKSAADELARSPEFEQSWRESHKHQGAHGG